MIELMLSSRQSNITQRENKKASKQFRVILLAIVIGSLNAVILKGFELAVDDGTNYIWNDLFHTNSHRWGVIPLAILLSMLFSALLILIKQKRVIPPKINSLESEESKDVPTIKGILIIAFIGLIGLLAGASLGPEATLMAIASGLGIWLAYRSNQSKTAKLLELSSIGALLVAFVGSFILVLLPLLILYKKKLLTLATALPVILAGGASYITLWLINQRVTGFGSIPVVSHFTAIDFALAALLGLLTAGLGWLLKRSILVMNRMISKLDKKYIWPLSAGFFGLIIGLLYLVGGQSIEFSGNKGSTMLLDHSPSYGLWLLFIILIAKLAVTGWSLASGYRGGLVFPSIFIGVAIALIIENIFGSAGPGVLIGSVAGVLSAMTGAAPAFIFIAGSMPVKLIGIAVVGIVFATIGNKFIAKLAPAK